MEMETKQHRKELKKWGIDWLFVFMVVLSLMMILPKANWFALIWLCFGLFEYWLNFKQRTFIKLLIKDNAEYMQLALDMTKEVKRLKEEAETKTKGKKLKVKKL